MSIQKPVAWCREPDKYGRRKLSFEKPTEITASTWHPLYALPGAQTQPAPSIPEGWKLVPIEPTEEMTTAFARVFNVRDQSGTFTPAFRAALAAAPEAKP